MKTKSILILSLFFSLFIFEKTFSKAFYIGQIISNEIEINKSFKIKLPKGEWEVVRKSTDGFHGIFQRIVGIVRVENNEVMEAIEIYEGLLGGLYQAAINEAITEMVFKNKYDGCYKRPEYYKLGLFRKGSTHNCIFIEPWDLPKELTNPDDPESRGMAAAYNKWIKQNNYIVPNIVLASNHSYFSRLVGGNWYRLTYIADPRMFNAPKTKFKTLESTEYHGRNIENFPEHKKVMDEFVKLSFQRHQEFENTLKARGYHRLKFEDLK
jgi:hypothetical protein